MIVGVVKEIKNNENRIALTPSCVEAYSSAGHKVLVEQGGGEGAGFSDDEYEKSGGIIVDTAADVWHKDKINIIEPLTTGIKTLELIIGMGDSNSIKSTPIDIKVF